MEVIGFYRDEVSSVLQLIASILKLGNVQFSPRSNQDGTDGCDISNVEGIYRKIISISRALIVHLPLKLQI